MKKLVIFSLMMLLAVAFAPEVSNMASEGGLLDPGWGISKNEL